MGLDMYLYEVSESGREPGFSINKKDRLSFDDEVLLSEAEYNTLPEEYKKHFVKGTETSTLMLIEQVATDIFKGNEHTLDKIKKTGSIYSKGEICLLYRINKDYVEIEVPKGRQVLDDTKDVTVAYEFESDDHETYKLSIIFRENVEDGMRNYKSKYVAERVDEVYSCIMDEVDYQRKGLNDTGWTLLPENCSYCGDRTVIENLCNRGGLSMSFLRNWEDGKTLFCAWW